MPTPSFHTASTLQRKFLLACVAGTLTVASFTGCSSSGTTAGDAGTSGTSGGGGTYTGTCATLEACCPRLATGTNDQTSCNYGLSHSGNNVSVCADLLKNYTATCGGGSSSGTSGSSYDGGSSGCASPGAEPAAMPTDCTAVAGACIMHEHEVVSPAAQPLCMQFNGQWAQIPDSAATQCKSGNAQHEWVAGKTCGEVVQGLQGGCETHPNNTSLCNTFYYGPGCATALGSSCNQNKSVNGLWVAP